MDLPNRTGIAWYRKTLDLPTTDQGKVIYLDFNGAMSQPKVFVNGRLAGEWAYGYNSFRIDITPFVKFGAPNTIAVRLDNLADPSRWYPGGGIYRHVWLVKASSTHIAHNGVFARSGNIIADSAEIVVTTEIQGSADGVDIVHTLLDAKGKTAASGRADAAIARLKVQSPALWQMENPCLYTLRTTLVRGDETLDSQDTPIGIIHFDCSAAHENQRMLANHAEIRRLLRYQSGTVTLDTKAESLSHDSAAGISRAADRFAGIHSGNLAVGPLFRKIRRLRTRHRGNRPDQNRP